MESVSALAWEEQSKVVPLSFLKLFFVLFLFFVFNVLFILIKGRRRENVTDRASLSCICLLRSLAAKFLIEIETDLLESYLRKLVYILVQGAINTEITLTQAACILVLI